MISLFIFNLIFSEMASSECYFGVELADAKLMLGGPVGKMILMYLFGDDLIDRWCLKYYIAVDTFGEGEV